MDVLVGAVSINMALRWSLGTGDSFAVRAPASQASFTPYPLFADLKDQIGRGRFGIERIQRTL